MTEGAHSLGPQGEHHGNDTGLDHQPRAAPSRLNPCIQGFAVGVNCAAAAVIVALAGKTSAQGHHVAAIARAFWPRRSSNRRWLAHKIVQQPVPKLLSDRFPFQQGPAKSGSIPESTLIISHRV